MVRPLLRTGLVSIVVALAFAAPPAAAETASAPYEALGLSFLGEVFLPPNAPPAPPAGPPHGLPYTPSVMQASASYSFVVVAVTDDVFTDVGYSACGYDGATLVTCYTVCGPSAIAAPAIDRVEVWAYNVLVDTSLAVCFGSTGVFTATFS